MLSYIYCYFCLLIGGHILGTANAFIYILLLLFTYWCAYTWYGKCFHIYTATFVYWLVRLYLVRQMLSYIYCYFCLLIGGHILGTATAFIYLLLLSFTEWYAYTWYGKCFHIYTAAFVYWLVRVYLVQKNAFIYILLLLFTDWFAYTYYGKCFHIYTATFVYLLVGIYLARQMLSCIYCYFCLQIGTRILGTANAFIYILLLLFTDWYAYTLYGKCFHIYTATFVYRLVRVYLVQQNAFQIYTASFVYRLVRAYLVRQMLSYIYCYFCLLIDSRILITANAFIYILLLLFTYWWAYNWRDKCFHVYTATFDYCLVRVYLVRQMLSYIYCYFCWQIGTRILSTANAFICILQLLFTDWCA